MKLRDYQAQAVESVLREYETVGSTLAVLPTATGKTVVVAEVMRQFDGPCIFVAHREELLRQAQRVIEKHSGARCEFELGELKAREAYPCDVLLASVQSLISGRNGLGRRMNKFSPFSYGLLVIDETHHATTTSYRAVLDYFKTNSDLKILGVTATPERHDEAALGQIFESVAYDLPIRQAIKDGWLVPVEQQLIDIQTLDFSECRTTAGDLNLGDLAAVLEDERNLYGICDAAAREIGNRKAIMFTVTVRQAERAAEILNRYRNGMAEWASGKTDKEERRRIMRDFSCGKFQILVNCNLVSEGYDVPDAELLIQARPTKSKLLYQQQLGRVMRPLPGVVDSEGFVRGEQRVRAIAASPKPLATVMDFVGNAGRHKLVHAIDCLGGKFSDEQRELAELELRKTGRPQRVDEIQIEADRREAEAERKAAAARRAKLTGKATYTVRLINPFDAFDIYCPPDRAWYRGKTLSVKQRQLLLKQGLNPDQLSYKDGHAIIQEFFRRWNHGLATLRQCELLKRYGYETKDITKNKAGELITELKANGWRKP